MQVVVFERNRQVARRVARQLLVLGAEVVIVEEPAQLAAAIPTAALLCADVFDGDAVLEAVRAFPRLRALLWTAEPARRAMRYLCESPSISNLLGRKDFESSPRPWELLMVARRILMTGVEASSPKTGQTISTAPAGRVPREAFVDWGHAALERQISSSAERDLTVAAIQERVTSLQVPKRVAEMFGELAHELIMNAMYDAPVDAQGRPRYAADRKAELRLEPREQPTVWLATDGSRLVLQVADPFGRLQRHHVMNGLARGLAGGEMDQSHGGAGLGMMMCHNSAALLVFDVRPGIRTEVTAVFELDLNLREFRTQARSIHYFES
jgi:hypothetical protein